MKTERTYEFKLIETISPLQHLAFLCKMLEAVEIVEKELAVDQSLAYAEDSAA
jgi:hypothetical protein